MAVTAEEMTLEQKRALALARARVRAGASMPDAAPDPAAVKAADIKRQREAHPVAAGVLDLTHGALGMTRGALNIVTPSTDGKNRGVGDVVADSEFVDRDSGLHLTGALLDPVAWATGSNVVRIAPYAKVLGKDAIAGTKAVLKNLGAGAATGGIVGGLTGDEAADDATKGAVIGALVNQSLPPSLRLVASAGRGLKNLLSPSPGQLAVHAAGDKVDDVITALETQRMQTAGSPTSAGQAAAGAGSAEFSALQALAASRDPSRYTDLAAAQEGARRRAVQSVGRTKADLDSAVGKRRADSEVNYKAAFQQQIKADGALMAMSDNPFFQKALPDAERLAKANGIDPKNNLTEFLHFVKVSLDKQMAATGDNALGNTEKHAVESLQKQLLGWLKVKNPKYESARASHEAASKPIEQMELGQELERALVSPVGKERPLPFGTSLRNMGVKEHPVTGRPLVETFTPPQRQVLDALMGDLQRDQSFKALAAKGADSLTERIDPIQVQPIGIFKPVISAARSWFNRSTGRLTDKGISELAVLMADDPKTLAAMMRKFTPAQRRQVQAQFERFVMPATAGTIAAGNQ